MTPNDSFDPQLAAKYPARILVAEDNEVNQKVIVRTLQKLGYAPVCVPNGRAAVEAFQRADFDLVFMDIEMPELDGPAATRELRTKLPAARQPVVVAMTAHALAESRQGFMASGMDGYLAKPLRLEDLISLLTRFKTLRPPPRRTRWSIFQKSS